MKQKQNLSNALVITRTHLVIGAIILIGSVTVVFALLSTRHQGGNTIGRTRVEMPHIHGLGFSSDGSRLLVPAHIGLLVYENNQWSQPNLPVHDYMGYSPIDSGFFSSGHPDLRTDYEPLLGLIKSEDGGRTITTLAFEGESDFHLMAAGYRNHAVYVINQSPNSQLGLGMFYTLNEGQTWQPSQALGLGNNPIQLAVHPDQPSMVAAATENGLWLSTDFGSNFDLVFSSEPTTAVTFSIDGNALYFGYQQFYELNLENREIMAFSNLVLEGNSAATYIADNPTSRQLAIATSTRDIFVLGEDGRLLQIADDGIGGL